MIKTRFCIYTIFNLGTSHLNPHKFYFNVEDNFAIDIIEQAKEFFEEYKKNKDLHKPVYGVPPNKISYELRIVDWDGNVQ